MFELVPSNWIAVADLQIATEFCNVYIMKIS